MTCAPIDRCPLWCLQVSTLPPRFTGHNGKYIATYDDHTEIGHAFQERGGFGGRRLKVFRGNETGLSNLGRDFSVSFWVNIKVSLSVACECVPDNRHLACHTAEASRGLSSSVRQDSRSRQLEAGF